jgi:cobalt-zinc-cadmium efflux system membrane fusion protein
VIRSDCPLNAPGEQIAAAHFDVVAARGGTLSRRITVPGTIIPVADRIARVSVKLSGTVAELRKRLGDPVVKDEVVAVLESREVADAKSEYLAARLTNELQQMLFQRDKMLWDGHAILQDEPPAQMLERPRSSRVAEIIGVEQPFEWEVSGD